MIIYAKLNNAAKLLGAERTLWKPFDLDELRRAVREVLNPS